MLSYSYHTAGVPFPELHLDSAEAPPDEKTATWRALEFTKFLDRSRQTHTAILGEMKHTAALTDRHQW